jgi:hypothetical protein
MYRHFGDLENSFPAVEAIGIGAASSSSRPPIFRNGELIEMLVRGPSGTEAQNLRQDLADPSPLATRGTLYWALTSRYNT